MEATTPLASPTTKSSRHLVILVHGIRTFGQWQEQLKKLLDVAEPGIEVVMHKYGYYSVLAYAIPFLRWLVTRDFRNHLVKLTAAPYDRIDLVGHSFGTYVVSWGLRSLPPDSPARIHTVILAASVLKPDFAWDTLLSPVDGSSRVHRVINDCGLRDMVLVCNQLFILFAGLAGRTGFTGPLTDRLVNRYHPFGHSDYFLQDDRPSDYFMKEYWLPYLLTDKTPDERLSREPGGVRDGVRTFLIDNAEPFKLCAWTAPFLAVILLFFSLYKKADAERARAEEAAALARATSYVSAKSLFELHRAVAAQTSAIKPEALHNYLSSIKERLTSLLTDAFVTPDQLLLDPSLTWVYLTLADIERQLGDYHQAEEHARVAAELIHLFAKLGDERAAQTSLAILYQRIGSAYDERKDYAKAVAWFDRSRAVFQELLGAPKHEQDEGPQTLAAERRFYAEVERELDRLRLLALLQSYDLPASPTYDDLVRLGHTKLAALTQETLRISPTMAEQWVNAARNYVRCMALVKNDADKNAKSPNYDTVLENYFRLGLDAIARAVQLGYRDAATLDADKELAVLRTDPRYRSLVNAMKENQAPGKRSP
jgi:tetratricopeptide (TPR) repeat protein